MRLEPEEFRQLFIDDPDVRVLIVEGDFDLRLWRRLVPPKDRSNTTVYSIDAIDIKVVSGGNKGRSLALAEIVRAWPEAGRIHFFVDRDYDVVPVSGHGPLVTLSDGRDVESYLLHPDALSCFCELSEDVEAVGPASALEAVDTLIRPVATMRIASLRNGWGLPFQKVLPEDTLKRFFRKTKGGSKIDAAALGQALLSSASVYVPDDIFEAEVALVRSSTADMSCFSLVHGKDLIACFSWLFRLPATVITAVAILTLTACLTSLRTLPGLGFVEAWVRA